ncbi:MAG: SAM-dependent chlorinase/fluorinase [Bacteroidales bacterium]|jgi:S-adenosylmethionine hydrolase|nr:SAM-dependent chlorinase/fluorinase [Bacteroidales bacterium]
MPIITLTSDWNNDDFYIGAVKGAIYSNCDNITVIDITHKIKPFNIFQAAFLLKNCYNFYPKGTVHILGVKTEQYENQRYLAAEFEGQYFLGTDNGIFSLLFKDEDNVKYITLDNYDHVNFPTLNVFSKVACLLAKGENIDSLGSEAKSINRRVPLRATIEDNVITGSIVYIDSFQNAITNVSKNLFDRVGNGNQFKIFVQSNAYMISKINKTYQETSDGEILAIFNSLNLLEIAINGGNAAELLNLDTKSSIRIKFQ